MYEKTISDPKKFEMIKARERAIRDYAGRMAYERKHGNKLTHCETEIRKKVLKNSKK